MNYYFSFDVETVGLYGPPFAYGWCVVDEHGQEYDNSLKWFLHPYLEMGIEGSCLEDVSGGRAVRSPLDCSTQQDVQWVTENVLSHLPKNVIQARDVLGLVLDFWKDWRACKARFESGNIPLTMVTDCPYPVESHFLRNAILASDVNPSDLIKCSPYPVIDVASVLLARGWDPMGAYDRRPNEEPAHNPLSDARQSVRLMLDALGRSV